MIRKSLDNVRKATFCVELPNRASHDMPMPTGTGFFISPDGFFVTAAHVTSENGASDGPQRNDIDKAWLTKESTPTSPGAMCQFMELKHVLPKYDLALLKVDFHKNSNKEWLKGKAEFPFIPVSRRPLEMGEPVYSFGYPLSLGEAKSAGGMVIGRTQLSPRVTSAIVSSDLDRTNIVMTSSDPQYYVLDKALNYGNSGGPIIATETGCVHALCSRFQPLFVPQQHLADAKGEYPFVMIPSLYGVVSSLRNQEVLELFSKLMIPISE
jgi:serine protease Do